ncbi:conjugal transfer protein [Streptomyces sp. NPDC004267]|uniref:conjugal transfer protein n=1 Tax=Streptomyces sp. NPDC004267 TaxID=3364694 RepID=UPI0036A41647
MFLGLWLRSGFSEQGLAARALKAMAPSVRVPVWGKRPPTVEALAAVRTVRVGDGVWSVTVAAAMSDNTVGEEYGETGAGVRYFAVPVTLTDHPQDSGAWTFTAGAPSEVTGPTAGQLPDPSYGARVEAGPLADSVTGFLAAYLGTSGGAERYLAPGVVLSVVSAAGYRAVEVEQVFADRPESGQVPGADGVAVHVRVEVVARDAAGRRWPLSYALALTARAGRWEITAVESGLTFPKTTS